MSLIKEIEVFGEVRCDGCILTIDKATGEYLMRDGEYLFGGRRLRLDVEHTNEARLEAHWDGFRSRVHADRVAARAAQ